MPPPRPPRSPPPAKQPPPPRPPPAVCDTSEDSYWSTNQTGQVYANGDGTGGAFCSGTNGWDEDHVGFWDGTGCQYAPTINAGWDPDTDPARWAR